MVKIHCLAGKKHRLIGKFVPANRSEQTRFGLVDEVVIGVIGCFLLAVISLAIGTEAMLPQGVKGATEENVAYVVGGALILMGMYGYMLLRSWEHSEIQQSLGLIGRCSKL